MSDCKLFEFLFDVFPLKKWQSFLILRHMQDCPRCQEKLAGRDEVFDLMIREDHVLDDSAVWAGFESKLKSERRRDRPVRSPRWKWAYGIVAAFVIVAGVFVVSNISQWSNGHAVEIAGDHFQINYLRIEGKPAQAFLFKPQGTDMILVWAQKNTAGE
jgi:hypothetical protein